MAADVAGATAALEKKRIRMTADDCRFSIVVADNAAARIWVAQSRSR
ncbi:hypothetical protein [Stenotrophomonas humi]